MKLKLSPLYRQLMKHANGWPSQPGARPPYQTSGEHSNVSMRQSPRAQAARPAVRMLRPLHLAPKPDPRLPHRSQF